MHVLKEFTVIFNSIRAISNLHKKLLKCTHPVDELLFCSFLANFFSTLTVLLSPLLTPSNEESCCQDMKSSHPLDSSLI
ncbi:hypothetical protein CEXT_175481 [Caerostris extrusa]|uniref:Uncharacterized protein n=1 Tax=Caerostris extrusa TaxID=172846 RepID=A0AAV4XD00_CAEEX|nr:hypothetical protein CEXT_175481 [Caerostris extrusa]